MKASPIIVNWHAENAPIYSADFQPHGKGRLATGGGDNNVRVCSDFVCYGGEELTISSYGRLIQTERIEKLSTCVL